MALTSMIRICIFDSSMSPVKSKISFVHKLLRRSSFIRIDKTGALALQIIPDFFASAYPFIGRRFGFAQIDEPDEHMRDSRRWRRCQQLTSQ